MAHTPEQSKETHTHTQSDLVAYPPPPCTLAKEMSEMELHCRNVQWSEGKESRARQTRRMSRSWQCNAELNGGLKVLCSWYASGFIVSSYSKNP